MEITLMSQLERSLKKFALEKACLLANANTGQVQYNCLA